MPATTPVLGLPYPTPDEQNDVPRDIKALADSLDRMGTLPVGGMLMWPGAAAPAGFLLCNGSVVSAATYPGLAAVLGSAGGNVTLPDYRDVFPVGAGPTMALGSRGGASSVGLTVAQMPSHNHGGGTGARDRSQSHNHVVGGNWMAADLPGSSYPAAGAGIAPSPITVVASDPADHLHSISAQGGGGLHENRPPFQAINFIIRAG